MPSESGSPAQSESPEQSESPAQSETPATPDARVGLIWAQAVNGVIGDAGTIPWRLPEDLTRFKELTLGGAVIMGRRTWDSLPERFRPLAGRHNIVITRQPEWAAEGATTVHSLPAALDRAIRDAPAAPQPGTPQPGTPQPVWIIGGGDIYRQAMPLADHLEITEVDIDAAGDTVAPVIDAAFTRSAAGAWLTSRTGLRYRFVSYLRIR